MTPKAAVRIVVFLMSCAALAQTAAPSGAIPVTNLPITDPNFISPSRPVQVGQAPGMKVKVLKDVPGEKVYAVIFSKGDEALSGLTDFAIKNKVRDAHFTGIGAVSSATVAWLDAPNKVYHRIAVPEQVSAR